MAVINLALWLRITPVLPLVVFLGWPQRRWS